MKKALSFSEMIKYLIDNKNIDFNEIDEDIAEKIIKKYGYFNVITPFKFRFADVDPENKSKSLLTSEGKHICSNSSEFSQWYRYFEMERKSYPIIYNNIVKLKTLCLI